MHKQELIEALTVRRLALDVEIQAQIGQARAAKNRALTMALIRKQGFFWVSFSNRIFSVYTK
jgi:hypothetical protein